MKSLLALSSVFVAFITVVASFHPTPLKRLREQQNFEPSAMQRQQLKDLSAGFAMHELLLAEHAQPAIGKWQQPDTDQVLKSLPRAQIRRAVFQQIACKRHIADLWVLL